MTDLIIEQARSYFDALVKSRFIEMFGCIDLFAQKSDWIPIGKVGTILTGSTPKTNEPSYWDGNLKWITPAELTSDSFIIKDTERKITEEGRRSCTLNLLEPGVVLLSSRAPIGKVAIVGSEMYCNQGFKNIKCSSNLNNVYLYVLLKNNTEYLNSLGRGATFKEISAKIVENICIPVPPVDLQNQFVEFFKQVDKSKVIFEKEVARYDDLIKSRFIEMFGTVRDNNLSLPIMKMGDIVEIRNGRDYKTIQNDNGKYPVYGTGGIITHADDYLCPENTVIIGRKGTINNPILVKEKFWNVDTAFGIICDQNVLNPIYYFWFCKQYDFTQHNKATTIPSLVKADLQKISVIVPDKERQDEFASFVKQVDKSKLMLFESLKNIAPNN